MHNFTNHKSIVICCDGTGNQFADANSASANKSSNSNVVKLYTTLTINNQQVGYYHPGVGTMGAPQARSRLARRWSVLTGLAIASGFMNNVEDAYRYLMETYNDGDHIYLFGFSRGAYTARALAAILHAYGLLCKGNEGQIPYVLRLFQEDMKAARKESKQYRDKRSGMKKTSLTVRYAFKETFSHDVTLRFVGLWDTVSSVGWISQPLRLLYSAQNPIIETGRHAISIDERRCFYQDNLWGPALPSSETPMLKREVIGADGAIISEPILQDILQVWFAGVHSDIGGSYPQCESALPNITLRWLLDEAIANGLQVESDRVNLIFGMPTKQTYASGPIYLTPPEPGIVHKSLHGVWWLLEFLPHRYYVMDTGEEHWRFPLGSSRTLPIDSVVHSSVAERLNNPAAHYKPRNLARGRLLPHPGTQIGTTANLTDFYFYSPIHSDS
jgi:uncharacterized protein (DUF2235 family)